MKKLSHKHRCKFACHAHVSTLFTVCINTPLDVLSTNRNSKTVWGFFNCWPIFQLLWVFRSRLFPHCVLNLVQDVDLVWDVQNQLSGSTISLTSLCQKPLEIKKPFSWWRPTWEQWCVMRFQTLHYSLFLSMLLSGAVFPIHSIPPLMIQPLSHHHHHDHHHPLSTSRSNIWCQTRGNIYNQSLPV